MNTIKVRAVCVYCGKYLGTAQTYGFKRQCGRCIDTKLRQSIARFERAFDRGAYPGFPRWWLNLYWQDYTSREWCEWTCEEWDDESDTYFGRLAKRCGNLNPVRAEWTLDRVASFIVRDMEDWAISG